MKIIVLGGGMVGSAIVADLCKDNEVTCADINQEVLNSITEKLSVKTVPCDFSDLAEVKKTISPFDLVIGAVPGFLGFEVLKAIIESKKNVVDISFFPEDAFLLDDLAKKNNVTAIVDCGVAPGLCNMMAGLHNRQMKLSSYECLVGGLPVVRTKPYEYKAPFSPVDVLEEYTRPARYIENGKLVIKEALSEVEQINFEQCGTLEYFNSDGLRSLITTLANVPDMKEKTLRYPGHADLMRVYRESGFFEKNKIKLKNAEVAPIDLISKLLFSEWKYKTGEEDFTIMRVTLSGTDEKGEVKIIYTLYDRYNKETETMSMARTTGYTCTAAARLIIENKFSRKGVSPPEFVGEDEKCFDAVVNYLKERKVVFKKEVVRS
ncbi:MAG TPA: saccharopine dehydrogenase C-terminal domain-containing protein [Bacteroidia bacterium]|nr:saccharopine dehydrogenase C-terminal domain-containing protein [Bacteroidia bacterium]